MTSFHFSGFAGSSARPPVFEPIQAIGISERWFPAGLNFGLYESPTDPRARRRTCYVLAL